jgi:hypothetical protein
MKTATEQSRRGRGRPSLYTQELADNICERLMEGQTLIQICQDEAMPALRTVLRWEIEKPEFGQVSARARRHGTDVLAEQCISIADDPNIDPHDKRVRIDTRLRLIGKWNARKYGDRIAHEVATESKFIPLDELADKVRRIQLENNRLLMVGEPEPA